MFGSPTSAHAPPLLSTHSQSASESSASSPASIAGQNAGESPASVDGMAKDEIDSLNEILFGIGQSYESAAAAGVPEAQSPRQMASLPSAAIPGGGGGYGVYPTLPMSDSSGWGDRQPTTMSHYSSTAQTPTMAAHHHHHRQRSYASSPQSVHSATFYTPHPASGGGLPTLSQATSAAPVSFDYMGSHRAPAPPTIAPDYGRDATYRRIDLLTRAAAPVSNVRGGDDGDSMEVDENETVAAPSSAGQDRFGQTEEKCQGEDGERRRWEKEDSVEMEEVRLPPITGGPRDTTAANSALRPLREALALPVPPLERANEPKRGLYPSLNEDDERSFDDDEEEREESEEDESMSPEESDEDEDMSTTTTTPRGLTPVKALRRLAVVKALLVRLNEAYRCNLARARAHS
jgi:hypothetical protein